MTKQAQVTIAVPSFNQAQFLDDALASIFQQEVPVEIFVMDGGSTDNSLEIIRKWEHKLAGWRSHADNGQAAAINEGILLGSAPYVCWLNSDDMFLPGGLLALYHELELHKDAPAAYGRAMNYNHKNGTQKPVWVEPFSVRRMALRCIVSQPATLIRRSAWEAVGGLDEDLHLSMDYDLWWRLYKQFGPLRFVDTFVAVNREHVGTKTRNNRKKHYQESIKVVRNHYGKVPSKWWLAQPYTVWFRTLMGW